MSIRDCLRLALGLSVALAKFSWCYSLGEALAQAYSLS